MSFNDGTGVKIFPAAEIRELVTKHTLEHGKPPKTLVISQDDYLDYRLSRTLVSAQSLGVEKIAVEPDLEPGMIVFETEKTS